MAFFNFFKSGKDDNGNINVTKVPQKSIADGSMASASPARATEELAQVIAQQQAAPQILVIGTENFSKNLVEYALKMGKRLDCQLVAVNTIELPLSYSEQEAAKAKEEFYAAATKAGVQFAELAASIDVSLVHMMQIGEGEQILHDVSKENPGVRYVLTEPESTGNEATNTAQIPVFDLACSRL